MVSTLPLTTPSTLTTRNNRIPSEGKFHYDKLPVSSLQTGSLLPINSRFSIIAFFLFFFNLFSQGQDISVVNAFIIDGIHDFTHQEYTQPAYLPLLS